MLKQAFFIDTVPEHFSKLMKLSEDCQKLKRMEYQKIERFLNVKM